jgi:hypothetical protein
MKHRFPSKHRFAAELVLTKTPWSAFFIGASGAVVASLRDSRTLPTLPGTYVPGYQMPPLRGWSLVDSRAPFSCKAGSAWPAESRAFSKLLNAALGQN